MRNEFALQTGLHLKVADMWIHIRMHASPSLVVHVFVDMQTYMHKQEGRY